MRRTENNNEEGIYVKVARTGGAVKEVCLNGDRSLQTALDLAEVEYTESSRIRVNGESVSLDDDIELEDGDRVNISGKIKGGSF
jgi:hypothetical protein